MKANGSQTRRLLLIGFGGLLALLALTGLEALSVLAKIEIRNERIRADYINRDRILEQLRSDIYQSGTYVRDFLLEPDSTRADIHKREFEAARERIQKMVDAYSGIQRKQERSAFAQFRRELASYFISLEPVLAWTSNERRTLGYPFMRDSLLPRRVVIVHLADQISGVNQKQVEAGATQVADLFSDFRKFFIALLVLTLVVGTVLAGGSIYRILRLERLSAAQFQEVAQARSDLRELSTRLLEVQEEERRSLSRELHDEVGQSLSALVVGLGNAAATIPAEGNPKMLDELQDLRQMAEKTVRIVRDMSLLLRPSMLDDLGLVPALQWQAREMSRRKDLPVEVTAGSTFEDLSDDYKTCIYRVVQEALYNVARHANATGAQVRLLEREQWLLLSVRDDGKGFRPELEKGIGLLGMEERVVRLGGRFRVESQLGKGALITVELPPARRTPAGQKD